MLSLTYHFQLGTGWWWILLTLGEASPFCGWSTLIKEVVYLGPEFDLFVLLPRFLPPFI